MFSTFWIIYFLDIVIDSHWQVINYMVTTHRRCKGSKGSTCHRFLPLHEKHSHEFVFPSEDSSVIQVLRHNCCKLYSFDDWYRVYVFTGKVSV